MSLVYNTLYQSCWGLLLMPKIPFFSKDTRFFAFFQQEAENTIKMAKQLKDLIYSWQNVKERASVIADMEREGNAITHDIMTLLYHSFITPLDREDITALTNSLDNIADCIRSTADTMYLYGIERPTDRAKELSNIILQGVLEVGGGVSEINSTIRDPNVLLKRCITINRIENAGDLVYRAALAELFDPPNNSIFVIKWHEIYDHMESSINGCEKFADILEGIATKYA
jgi:uncharacterized protein